LIRRARTSTALAALSLALAASGGAAFAASRFLITSTSQIKPAVLRAIEQNAASRVRALVGPAPVGSTGPQGESGAPGATGQNGAAAGLFATASNVPLPSTPDGTVVVVTKNLPRGDFVVVGGVDVLAEETHGASEFEITCTMTDTPNQGQPTQVSVTMDPITAFQQVVAPATAAVSAPVEDAVESPQSPSSLELTCQAMGIIPTEPPVGAAGFVNGTLAAVQTSANS
jgi:hypothetical protein